MKIAGLQKNSFVDYPEKIAAVIFTPGCNMNCFYCHNQVLLGKNADKNLIDTEEVLGFLAGRRGFLEGVVISGGEPMLQSGLEEFMQDVKRMGYSVKLDTNGTNPCMLKKLIDGRLVDYVAMDIKAPLHKYSQICRTYVNINEIQESIDLLMQGRVDYEFRTTFVPRLNEEDILRIAGRIKGARLYVLQQFRGQAVQGKKADTRLYVRPHSSHYIKSAAEKIKDLVERCETRGCV